MSRRKPKLKPIAGRQKKTVTDYRPPREKTNRQWRLEKGRHCFAAVASSRLSLHEVCRRMGALRIPYSPRVNGFTCFLFETGEDRDFFVEEFHRTFNAKAIPHGEA